MQPTSAAGEEDSTMIVRGRLTIDEYMQQAEAGAYEGRRVQLLRGEVIELSPQSESHADVIERFMELLFVAFLKDYRIRGQLPFCVSPDSLPEPDIAIIPRSLPRDGGHPSQAVAVIEVSEATLRLDRKVKRELYAAAGVPEYWIINLTNRQIEIYREPVIGPDGAGYASETIARGEEEIRFHYDSSVPFIVGQILRGEALED